MLKNGDWGFSPVLCPLAKLIQVCQRVGDCWGKRVSCALLRLTVQLHPQNKTSLSHASEQPKPELIEQTALKGEGFCQTQ